MTDFDEYIQAKDPSKRNKAYAWATAIGLQAVDGLTTSDYLQTTAQRHIEGEIDIDEAQKLIHQYYQKKSDRLPEDDEKEEADRVSGNITKLLQSPTMNFSAQGYLDIHRHVFDGVFKFAGQIRDYDITKKEWVLRGDTVSYLNHLDIRRALEYEIEKERQFDYKNLSTETMIAHIAHFVSNLWQIHAFGEGNTRTTAVFTIMYLRSIGFNVDNDLFAKHSWYFRNALVRANYKNAAKGIIYTFDFLELFFRNLLLKENNELKNRYLIINPPAELSDHPTSTPQVPHKYPTSSENSLFTTNPAIISLVKTIDKGELSINEILEKMRLKDRKNFTQNYLRPAMDEGFVRPLYPDSPRHPRQKYLLTVKGLTLLSNDK